MGHRVRVFAPFKENFVEKKNNLSVHFYNSQLKIGVMNVSYKLFFDPLNYPLDIIHVHNDTPISVIAGLRCAMKRGKPLVVTWHGDWIPNYGHIVRRIGVYLSNKFLVKKILSKADVIVTPSIYYVQQSRFLMKYTDKLIEIPNGINLQDFNIPYSKDECRKILGIDESKDIVLFVGGLYPLKGPHILLKAVPKIVKSHRNAFFIFVGGGDLSGYERLATKLGVRQYVKFTGYVKEERKLLYYGVSDIFVLPSIEAFEVFPLVLLEASANGLPIVTSDLETFKCLIENGYNGLFTKRGDAENLADAIIYLLENDDLRERMGRNAKEKVKAYSWEKIAEKYEEVYQRLVK